VVVVNFVAVIAVSNKTAFLADTAVPTAIFVSLVNASSVLQNLFDQGLLTANISLSAGSRRMQSGSSPAGNVVADVSLIVTTNSSSVASTSAQTVSTAVNSVTPTQFSSGITSALTALGNTASYSVKVLSVSKPVVAVNGVALPAPTAKPPASGTTSEASRLHSPLPVGSWLTVAIFAAAIAGSGQ